MKRELSQDWSEDFKKTVEASGLTDDLRQCLACGKCVGACPVAAITPSYSPRQIIRDVLMGNPERIIQSEELWRCFWCAGCASTCPAGIKFPLLMLVLRYYALEHGAGKKYVIPFKRFVERARLDGVTFQPGSKKLEKIKSLRSAIGLAPLRLVSEQARQEYQKLYELAGTLEWLDQLEEQDEHQLSLSFAAGKLTCIAGNGQPDRRDQEC